MATLNTSDISPQMIDGLAVYDLGHGIGQDETVLLMPSPAEDATSQSARSTLALLLLRLGKRVITFDPPGSNGSGDKSISAKDGLIPAALTSLNRFGMDGPVDMMAAGEAIPHALDFAHGHPDRVHRLVLVDDIPPMPKREVPLLADITMPVLLFLGECDRASQDRALSLANHLPNSQLIIQPDDGAHPHEDAPLHFGAILRRFLDDSAPRPGRVISVEM